MKFSNKAAVITAMVLLPLAGCTSTGTSSHGANEWENGTRFTKDGAIRAMPDSDYASLKGDKSAQLLALGKENFTNQNYGLSEKYFRQAVELRTDSASAWAGLAASYDHLGNFKFADRAYEQLIALKGNDARVYNNLGFSHLLRGDYKKARNYFGKAMTANPGLDEIHGNLNLLDKVTSS